MDLLEVRAKDQIKRATEAGVKEEDVRAFLKGNSVPDFDADSLVIRMNKAGALDSYDDVMFILDKFRPKMERRRTEAELD